MTFVVVNLNSLLNNHTSFQYVTTYDDLMIRRWITWKSRWGIILRSTVQTSDISWFSLPLPLQNGRTETGYIRHDKCWPRLFCVFSIFQIDDGSKVVCFVPTANNILLRYRLVVGYTILPSLVPHELSPCQVRIFIKTYNFDLFWIVQFHHWCYSTISCKAAWSAKVNFASYWVNIDVTQTYRIHFDSLFITMLSIIETYPWAWECACIAHLYWNWYDAIRFVTLSLIQCIHVLKCRVIICLDNRFMNVRPQVPQHSPEQTQSFFIIPFKLQ